jgi:hypothetical protein
MATRNQERALRRAPRRLRETAGDLSTGPITAEASLAPLRDNRR